MEPLFGLMMGSVVASVAYLIAWSVARDRARVWQEAAREVELENVQLSTSLGILTRLVGRKGPLKVTLERFKRGKSRGTRVVVGGLGHGSQLLVRPEGFGSLFEKALGERETELGDVRFDDQSFLQGNPALIRAVFDAKTRALLEPLLGGRMHVPQFEGEGAVTVRAWIASDELNVEIQEAAFDRRPNRLPQALRLLVAIGDSLVRPADLADRIAANTEVEPIAGVRLANLRALATDYPSHPATRRSLAAALSDSSLPVRFEAATALGPPGRETLLDLATRDDADDGLSARALAAIGSDIPTATVIATLRAARTSGRRAVARACIEAIARRGAVEGVEELAATLGGDDAELAASAAAALGVPSFQGTSAERRLIAALEHDDAEVRVAAARSLGPVGTPLAVVPLAECASSHRFDLTLRAAARQSTAEIQARVTGASPGQLSIALDAVGQVSLSAGDASGRVSLPPKPADEA